MKNIKPQILGNQEGFCWDRIQNEVGVGVRTIIWKKLWLKISAQVLVQTNTKFLDISGLRFKSSGACF